MINKFNYNIDFLGKKALALALSAALLGTSIFSFFLQGLTFGIDFTGGTLIEIGYTQPVELTPIRSSLHSSGFPDAIVQHFGTNRDVLIRLKNREKPAATQDSQTPIDLLSTQVLSVLQQQNSDAQMRRVEFVGPQVGNELVEQGGLAVLYTLIGILIYVTFRFEYRLSFGAIAALAHDTVITVGVFSLFQMEFDLTVLAAVLAVIGYSINDTIVVFDRIRDNFLKMRKQTPEVVINTSINQTLTRTIMTSGTTLLVVVVLFAIGGELIHGFATALLVGITVGTYSSIYVASTLALALGIDRKSLLPVQKEGADLPNA